jgi:hypothetical protein
MKNDENWDDFFYGSLVGVLAGIAIGWILFVVLK